MCRCPGSSRAGSLRPFWAGAAGAAGAGAAFLPFAAGAGTAGPPSLTSWRMIRDLRRAALLRWTMPFEAARSRERTASRATAARSAEATGLSLNDFLAFVTMVLTSERTPRLRAERRTPARACFLAEAVRLANSVTTCGHQEGIEHESGIIESLGIRVRRAAP